MTPTHSITSLTAQELDALARDVARDASNLHFLAAERRELKGIASDARAANTRSRGIPGMVLAYLDCGEPYDVARYVIAASLGCSCQTVDLHWKAHLRATGRTTTRMKKVKILRLARAGLSNDAIAARLDLHGKSVSRILRQAVAELHDRVRTQRPPSPRP